MNIEATRRFNPFMGLRSDRLKPLAKGAEAAKSLRRQRWYLSQARANLGRLAAVEWLNMWALERQWWAHLVKQTDLHKLAA